MSLQCPICKGIAKIGLHAIEGDRRWIDCPRCGGEYEIGGRYAAILGYREQPMLELSSALRESFQTSQPIPVITEWTVPEILGRFTSTIT